MTKEYNIEYKGLEKRIDPMEEPKRKKIKVDELARVAICMDEWTRIENKAYEKELEKRNKFIEHMNEQYRQLLAKYYIMAESIHDMAAEIRLMQMIIDENAPNYPLTRFIVNGPYSVPLVRLREQDVPHYHEASESESDSDILDNVVNDMLEI